MVENILSRIHQGMAVYDREGEEVGKVKSVHSGAGEFTAEWNMAEDDAAHASFQEAEDLLPEETLSPAMREHLLQNGFVRVGTPRTSDRYIMPEQIEMVENKRVTLKVLQDDIASF